MQKKYVYLYWIPINNNVQQYEGPAIIEFSAENVMLTEIYHRLKAMYGEKTIHRSTIKIISSIWTAFRSFSLLTETDLLLRPRFVDNRPVLYSWTFYMVHLSSFAFGKEGKMNGTRSSAIKNRPNINIPWFTSMKFNGQTIYCI